MIKLIDVLKICGLSFIAACGVQTTNDSSAKIINGVDLDKDNPGNKSTVYLSVGCTGTLIGPNLVVTAAHCLYNKKQGDRSLKVHFGPEGLNPQHTRDIEEFKFHENYGPVFRTPPAFIHDIAWVKFSGNLPQGYEPSPILSMNGLKSLHKGQPMTLVGYGRVVYEQDNRRNLTHLKTGPARFNRFIDRNDPSLAPYAGMFVTQVMYGTGVCWGDSGGPAYVQVNSRWVLAGATNGRDGVVSEVGHDCSEGAARFAALGFYQSWIESTSGVKISTEFN